MTTPTTYRPVDGPHSVHVDRPLYRDHMTEIAAVLAERDRCDCPAGYRHLPECFHVTGEARPGRCY